MKPSFLFITGAAIFTACALNAQQSAAAKNDSPVLVGRSSKLAQAMTQIVTSLDAGDEAAATTAAALLCTSTAGTPFRHLELALRYLQLSQMSRDLNANQSTMNRFAALALAEALQTSTANSGVKAQGLEVAALIYENCLGDRTSAKASYAAAVQADPSAARAQKELDRLNAEDALASARAKFAAAAQGGTLP